MMLPCCAHLHHLLASHILNSQVWLSRVLALPNSFPAHVSVLALCVAALVSACAPLPDAFLRSLQTHLAPKDSSD